MDLIKGKTTFNAFNINKDQTLNETIVYFASKNIDLFYFIGIIIKIN